MVFKFFDKLFNISYLYERVNFSLQESIFFYNFKNFLFLDIDVFVGDCILKYFKNVKF